MSDTRPEVNPVSGSADHRRTRHVTNSATILQRLYQTSRSIAAASDEATVAQALMGFATFGKVDVAQLFSFTGFVEGRPTAFEVTASWAIDNRLAQPPDARLSLTDYPLFESVHRDSIIICENVATDSRLNEPTRRLMGLLELGSFALIPLTAGEAISAPPASECIGALIIGRDAPSVYEEELIYAWWTLAGQAAAITQSMRLHREAQQRLSDLSLLLDTSATFSSSLDLDTVLHTAAQQITTALVADGCAISLWDRDRDALVTRMDHSARPNQSKTEKPGTIYALPDYPASRQVMIMRQPLVVQTSDPGADAAEVAWMQEQEVASLLMVPMVVRDNAIGMLELVQDTRSGERQFTSTEIVLCQALANQAAAALENARLFDQIQAALEETAEQAHRLTLLNDMSMQLGLAESLDKVFKITAVKTEQILSSDRVSVALLNADGENFTVLALQGEKGAVPMGEERSTKGSSIAIAVQEKRLVTELNAQVTELGGLHSFMVAPIIASGRVIATLNVGSKRKRAYTSRDESLLLQIASLLSSAIENKQLFEQIQQRLTDLQTIQDTISTLIATLSFDEAAAALLPRVANAVQADKVSMFLIEDEQATRVAAYPLTEQEEALIGQAIPLADYPLTQKVIETRQPLALLADDPRLQDYARQDFQAAGVTASATIPLVGREGVLGTLAVSLRQPGRVFSAQDVSLLQTLADQATIAFERVRLFEQVRRRSVQLQTAAEISRAASSLLNPDELIQNVVDLVRERFGLYYAGLFLADEAGEWAVLSAGTGDAGRIQLDQGHKLEVGGDSMVGQSVATAQARIALDVQAESTRFVNPLLPETRSEMALPLVSRGQVIGAMTIQSTEKAAFSEDDIAALQTMADQLANAIQNARLFEERSRRTEELVALNLIASTVSQSLDMQELLDTVLEAVIVTTGFDAALITLRDAETDQLYLAAHRNLPRPLVRQFQQRGLPGTLCDVVFQTGETLSIGDMRQGDHLHASGLIEHGLYAYAGFPLVHKEKTLGTLCLFSRSTRDSNIPDSPILETIGHQIAVGVENARLFAETQLRAHHEQLLRQIMAQINASEDLVANIPTITENLCQLIPVDSLTLTSYTPGTAEFTLLAVGKETEDEPFAHLGLRSPLQGSAPGWVITHQKHWLDSDFRQDQPFNADESLVAEGLASRLILPLRVGEQVIGTLNLASKQPGVFSEAHLPMLSQIANQMALALERARLLEETSAALAEAQAIHQRYLRGEWEALFSSKQDRVWGYRDGPQGLSPIPPESEAATGQVDEVSTKIDDPDVGDEVRSGLTMPIRLFGQTIGVLDFYDKDHNWTEDDKALVGALADQAALALEGARLFEQTQASLAETRTLFQTSRSLAAAQQTEEIWQAVVDAARQRQADACLLLLLDTQDPKGARELVLVAGWERYQDPPRLPVGTRMPLSNFGLIDAQHPNRLFYTSDLNQAHELEQDARGFWNNLGFGALLHQPIAIRGRWFGLLAVLYDSPHAFNKAETDFYRTLGDQAALAFDGQRLLFETQRQAEREQLIHHVTDKVRATSDLETILKTTVQELSKALGLPRAFVTLGTEEEPTTASATRRSDTNETA